MQADQEHKPMQPDSASLRVRAGGRALQRWLSQCCWQGQRTDAIWGAETCHRQSGALGLSFSLITQ